MVIGPPSATAQFCNVRSGLGWFNALLTKLRASSASSCRYIRSGAVQVVGAALDDEVGHRGLAAAVLGADGAGLQLELLDRLGRRRHFVVAAALQVAAERHAFDQDLVRVVAPAVDRSLEGVADAAGQAREDELLDLALSVGDRYWPGLVLLVRDVAADLRRPRLDQRRRHRELFRDGIDVHLEVDGQCLCGPQRDVVGDRRPESRCRHVDTVEAVG